MISEQGKGQPKYVRMRGQAVEEVMTKTEYTSAVRLRSGGIQVFKYQADLTRKQALYFVQKK
jgi:hypothetical protein